MTEEICPACSCTIGPESVENAGVAYCCDPCAEGEPSECVTCTLAVETPKDQGGGGS